MGWALWLLGGVVVGVLIGVGVTLLAQVMRIPRMW